jgi:hypothetical protein
VYRFLAPAVGVGLTLVCLYTGSQMSGVVILVLSLLVLQGVGLAVQLSEAEAEKNLG